MGDAIELVYSWHIFVMTANGHLERPTTTQYGREEPLFSVLGYDSKEEAEQAIFDSKQTLGDYVILPVVSKRFKWE